MLDTGGHTIRQWFKPSHAQILRNQKLRPDSIPPAISIDITCHDYLICVDKLHHVIYSFRHNISILFQLLIFHALVLSPVPLQDRAEPVQGPQRGDDSVQLRLPIVSNEGVCDVDVYGWNGNDEF